MAGKITIASTEGVDQMREIAEAFMREIFGLEKGTYLITDESALSNFVPMDKPMEPIVHKIMRTYRLSLVPSNLLLLFREIDKVTRIQ